MMDSRSWKEAGGPKWRPQGPGGSRPSLAGRTCCRGSYRANTRCRARHARAGITQLPQTVKLTPMTRIEPTRTRSRAGPDTRAVTGSWIAMISRYSAGKVRATWLERPTTGPPGRTDAPGRSSSVRSCPSIELDTVCRQFEPYRWHPCDGETWDVVPEQSW